MRPGHFPRPPPSALEPIRVREAAGVKRQLWVVLEDGKLWLRDEKGQTAGITTPDVYQSNGVIHVIDSVVMAD